MIIFDMHEYSWPIYYSFYFVVKANMRQLTHKGKGELVFTREGVKLKELHVRLNVPLQAGDSRFQGWEPELECTASLGVTPNVVRGRRMYDEWTS